MRLVYVVQRYGPSIAGGAEQHCREIAERMSARGHDVQVATTCAESYVDWANVYPRGLSDVNGIAVHRFPVSAPRPNHAFSEFDRRVKGSGTTRPIGMQREWMRMLGPHAPELPDWLRRRGRDFDCIVFFTYLYWTTWSGVRASAGVRPTVLHPTVHDEPALQMSIYDEVFRAVDAFALSAPEEADLIRRRFRSEPKGDVVGVGVDLGRADPTRFRAAHPVLGSTPYLLYVGRMDPGKGALELYDFFVTYQRRNRSDLKLVFLGDPLAGVPEHPDVLVTGFVEDDAMRNSAIAGALALAQPSYFESFSMVLAEAFAQSRPALVQRRCSVLLGHARRSNAALPYAGFAEFEAALDLLRERGALADEMGRNGRRYVEATYTWDLVLDRYEALLDRVAAPA